MSQIDVETVDKDILVDIRDVNIDLNLSIDERRKQFLEQIKNPYCFKCGDIVIKLVFSNESNSPTMEECFKEYLANIDM